MKTFLQKISKFLLNLSHRSVVKELAYLALFLLTLFFMVLPVYAATYIYSIPIIVQYNTSVLYNQTVIATINNTQLNQYGYITAAALDTAFGPGLEDNPLMVATDRIVGLYPQIPQSQPTQSLYKLGWSPLQDFHYVMPGEGGNVTAADSPSLEPVANTWEVEWKGYLDTSKAGSLAEKLGVYGLYTSGNGTITAYQLVSTVTSNSYLYPVGAGAYTEITTVTGPATHWEAVDDPLASPDDTTSYVSTTSTGYLKDTYILTAVSPSISIKTIAVLFRISSNSAPGVTSFIPYVRLGGVDYLGSEQTRSDTTWTTYQQVVTKAGGWSLATPSTLEMGGSLKCTGGYAGRVTQVIGNVTYFSTSSSVTYTIPSGQHTIKASKWGTSLGLYVDGIKVGTNATVETSVYDTGSSFKVGSPSSAAEYVKVNIGGVPKLWWQPTSMITLAQVPDRSGGPNIGTINWGTNPSGLSVAFAGTTSSNSTVPASGSSAVAPAYLPTPGQANITQETMYADPAVTGSLLPGYDGFQRAAASLEWETKDLYALMMMFVALAVAFAAIIATGSMSIGAGTLAIFVGAGAGTGILDPITAIFLFVCCLVVIGIFRGS